jgi:hypothetical protein
LKQRIASLEGEKKELISEQSGYEMKIKSLENDNNVALANAKHKYEKMIKQLRCEQDGFKSCSAATIELYKQQIASLEQQTRDLLARVERFEKKAAGSEATNKVLEGAVKTLQGTVDSVQSERNSFEIQVNVLLKANDLLEQNNVALKEENAALKEENAALVHKMMGSNTKSTSTAHGNTDQKAEDPESTDPTATHGNTDQKAEDPESTDPAFGPIKFVVLDSNTSDALDDDSATVSLPSHLRRSLSDMSLSSVESSSDPLRNTESKHKVASPPAKLLQSATLDDSDDEKEKENYSEAQKGEGWVEANGAEEKNNKVSRAKRAVSKVQVGANEGEKIKKRVARVKRALAPHNFSPKQLRSRTKRRA